MQKVKDKVCYHILLDVKVTAIPKIAPLPRSGIGRIQLAIHERIIGAHTLIVQGLW